MSSISFPADSSSVTALVTFASASMGKRTFNKDKMKQYPLLFEELALKLIDCATQDAQITVSSSQRLGYASIEFRCPGSLVSLRPKDRTDFGGQILTEFRDYLSQTYSSGVNIITFSSPLSSADIVIPCACAAILAIAVAAILPLFASESQISWIVDNVTHSIDRLFIRCLSIFIYPTTFLTLVALIINLRMAVAKNRDILNLLFRYIFTSVIAIGIGFANAAILHRLDTIDSEDGLLAIADPFWGHSLSEFLDKAVHSNFIDPFLDANPIPMLILALVFGFSAGSYFNSYGHKIRQTILGWSGFLRYTVNLIFGFYPLILFFAILDNCLAYSFLDIGYMVASLLCFLPAALILLLVYAVILCCNGISPLRFLRDYRSILWANFKIGSNIQAIPHNTRTLSRKTGLPRNQLTDVLRLGATVNIDGSSLFCASGILIFCFYCNIPVTFTSVLALGAVILLGAVGTANQPGGFLLIMILLISFAGVSDVMYEYLLMMEVCLGRTYSFLNSLGDIVTVAVLDQKNKVKCKGNENR